MSDAPKNMGELSPEEKRALLARLLRQKAVGTDVSHTSSQAQPTTMPPLHTATLPLSHNQKALWFLSRLSPQSTAYNLLYSARVRSTLDVAALQRAVDELVRRYPILTATYGMQDGEPVQRQHGERAIALEQIDASALTLDEVRARLYEEANRPIDLEHGPIMRVMLFSHTVASTDHMLALIVHHIAVDFWALDILVDELYLLYAAERTGADVLRRSLAPVGEQHGEYVKWQREMLASAEGERHWSHWQRELAGELPLLNLPTDHARPALQSYKGASHSFALSDELARQLRQFAASERVTLYMLMLTAFQTLLYRYSHQDDILVGTPALGRTHIELEHVIDYLANPVVVRTSMAGNPEFRELLHRVQQTVLGALEHQDYPFPLLVEKLQPRRDASYSPIFQTLFIWDKPRVYGEQDWARLGQEQPGELLRREGLQLEPFVYGQQGAPFDLTLTIFELGSQLSADFRYNVDLFDPPTLARMEQHFLTLLTGVVADPTQPVLDLPLLSEREERQILVEWNETARAFPEERCIHQLFEEQVRKTPDAPAVIFGPGLLSYEELNYQANSVAHRLKKAGVGPDVLVGVCMERSLKMVVALLAVLKAGGAYVPLDPSYPQERLAYMLEDAGMRVVITEPELREHFSQNSVELVYLGAGDFDLGYGPEETLLNLVSEVGPDNLVYMIYTSGSTGRPKGVMNTHRGVCNRLWWMQQEYHLTEEDRVMQKTPFSFDVSAWEFFWPLITGACLVVARPGGHQDPAYLVELIEHMKITTMHFVPSMLQAFLQEMDLEQRCGSLRNVLCSGEALSYELQERFFACFAADTITRVSTRDLVQRTIDGERQVAGKVGLHNLYGPTEAAIDVTYWACRRDSRERVVPIGHPIANTQMYILDEAMHAVPVGVVGELYIGGVNLARGYHNQSALTAERFIANPFRPGERLFKTGDLGRFRADGAIEFLGRSDHQVKLRGFRIELGEIEFVLSQYAEVKEVVVVAREDVTGNKRLVAYIVPDRRVGQLGPSIESLRTYLKERLPYYMVPAAFVPLEALPLSPNGKVDRKLLPTPDTARPELEHAYEPPRTPAEEKLTRIWAEVLGLDRVGIHDNYFDLGGASIQSLEVIARANEVGIPLKLELLFEHQSIAEISEALQNGVLPEAVHAPAPTVRPVSTMLPEPVPAPAPVVPSQPMTRGNTIIESLGTYLPPKIVSTKEILDGCVKPLRFPLAKLTGINNRRMAGESEFAIDISKQAVADCLAKSQYEPQDIDLLVCCNISRCDRPGYVFSFEPSTALLLKQHFGFTNALVFDLDNACTGFFTGIYLADALLKAGLIRRALIVSGEYITHLVRNAQLEIESFMDSRLACLTVGDAGAAVILESCAGIESGFHENEMYTLGKYSDLCIAKISEFEHGGAIMFTDAVNVSAVNVKQGVTHAAHIIERSGWPHDSFHHVLIHQTSRTTIKDAGREINRYFGEEICGPDTVIDNISERANTATTTHMIALMDHIRSGRIKSGDNALFGTTGSGATIGTFLYHFDDLPDRMRRIEAGELTPTKLTEHKRFTPILPPTQRIRIESVGLVPTDVPVEKRTLELVRAAAEQCIADSAYERGQLDLVVFAGTYRDEFLCEPALASMVEGMLGINDDIESQEQKKTFAFDIMNGSLGLLNACYAATGMILGGKVNNALLVTSEVENNREVLPENLVGLQETGSALIVDKSPDGTTGFGNFVFRYHTEYREALIAHTALFNGKTGLHFVRDAQLNAYYLQAIAEAVRDLLALEGLTMEQICVILPPQISSEFITQLSATLHVERDMLVDVQAQNDLYTSSLPYALQLASEEGRAQPGTIGLIIGVGAGVQVGCATYYF